MEAHNAVVCRIINISTMGVKAFKDNSNQHRRFELVPPDGGWGYLVAISAAINFTTVTAFAGCFGMVYNDFIYETKMSSTDVTLLAGICYVSLALTGLITNPLLVFMTKRKLAFFGAILFNLGIFGTVVMTTPLMFFICQGILQGIGLGILYNLSYTLMNDYFIHKKVFIMNFVQTATALTTMVAPIFVKWSLDEYGSRGTLLLISGISLHSILAVLLMQPVEWHMKKVKINEKQYQKEVLADFKNNIDETIRKTNAPILNLTDLELSQGNCGVHDKTYMFNDDDKEKSDFRQAFETLIDPAVCKTFILSCACFGPSLCSAADCLQITLAPQYFYSLGWSQENVATALALYGFGDLAMRIVFTFISHWFVKLGAQTIYIIGVAIAVMARFGMLWSHSIIAMMIYFTLMGVAHCSVAVLIPVVISEVVPTEKFTSAMGIFLLLCGILGIILGPVVGAVRDLTNSYTAANYILTSFYLLIVILWPIELLIKKKQKNIN